MCLPNVFWDGTISTTSPLSHNIDFLKLLGPFSCWISQLLDLSHFLLVLCKWGCLSIWECWVLCILLFSLSSKAPRIDSFANERFILKDDVVSSLNWMDNILKSKIGSSQLLIPRPIIFTVLGTFRGQIGYSPKMHRQQIFLPVWIATKKAHLSIPHNNWLWAWL